jgi:phage FluMu protein Com
VRDYHCRKCRRWLFASDATSGRLRVTCPDRRCRTEQWVFLGGHHPAPPEPAPDCAILVASG